MPTRRVALGAAYLPMSGPAHGAALLAAVTAEHRRALDDEQLDAVHALLGDARRGLDVPRIALRHRFQTDVHGLDRSRHRVLGEGGHLVIELDVHGAPMPQLLGAVMAASVLPPTVRALALDAVRRALHAHGFQPAPGVVLRRVDGGVVIIPPATGATFRPGAPPEEIIWSGVAPEQRWAMEVLGLRPDIAVVRDDVNRRFRRMLRDAHPDHGGAAKGAGDRIAELTEARRILFDIAASAAASTHG
jgi:hypothetical protein